MHLKTCHAKMSCRNLRVEGHRLNRSSLSTGSSQALPSSFQLLVVPSSDMTLEPPVEHLSLSKVLQQVGPIGAILYSAHTKNHKMYVFAFRCTVSLRQCSDSI